MNGVKGRTGDLVMAEYGKSGANVHAGKLKKDGNDAVGSAGSGRQNLRRSVPISLSLFLHFARLF